MTSSRNPADIFDAIMVDWPKLPKLKPITLELVEPRRLRGLFEDLSDEEIERAMVEWRERRG